MSNEAPKKIWVIRDRYVVDPEKACERIVPYIRADLVDRLFELADKFCPDEYVFPALNENENSGCGETCELYETETIGREP